MNMKLTLIYGMVITKSPVTAIAIAERFTKFSNASPYMLIITCVTI